MSVTVKWGKEKLIFDLPAPDTPLAVLRHQVAERTDLAVGGFKLIHAGAVMKDNNAPVSAYGLRNNSLIAIIAPIDSLPPVPASSEDSIIASIHSELNHVRTSLSPSVLALLAAVPSDSQSLHKEHSRLAELLLQSLLRLDAIQTHPTLERARTERKAAVNEVQALLDRLDSGWAAH